MSLFGSMLKRIDLHLPLSYFGIPSDFFINCSGKVGFVRNHMGNIYASFSVGCTYLLEIPAASVRANSFQSAGMSSLYCPPPDFRSASLNTSVIGAKYRMYPKLKQVNPPSPQC